MTNLDHLDFLGDRVAPPTQARHTTYRLSSEPQVGVLWTYADHQDDGSYRRVGGGPYHADTDTYDQGAFNADDIARAAVVYLRDWRQTGDASSRDHAYELLRGLTYLQTASGPNAGNVVLWQQPDGTLNPSPIIKETPDPSDSDASYWLARSVWALGEGYARFKKADPDFARFLKRRLDLGVAALDRQVLDSYGDHMNVDGRRTPRWLVVDGADASAEAVLGLASYARAGGTDRARRVMRQLSNGIAEMAGGDARHWPFGGVLPWALSRSDWHAWSSQMPAALATAGRVLGDRHLRRAAARDSFTFDPWMLTSGGPDNGRLPARADGAQIAYGADSRVQSLMATGGSGGHRMAGLVAAWFFGANASHAPTYDPDTGVTFDGVEADGRVNQNSGAESTIHGLLTMLALDAHPGARRIARSATVTDQVGTEMLQAEDATLAGGATPVTPSDTWTGESQVRRHRLRLAARRRHRDLRARQPPALAAGARRRPAARQLGGHRLPGRPHPARVGRGREHRCAGRLPGAGRAAAADAAAHGGRLAGVGDRDDHRRLRRRDPARRAAGPAARLAAGARRRRPRHRAAAQLGHRPAEHDRHRPGRRHRRRLVVRRPGPRCSRTAPAAAPTCPSGSRPAA